MTTIFQKLPKDIINHIIPYTYQFQNKSLLEDIISYKESKEIVFTLYYNFWIKHIEEIEPEDKHWLINDIFAYANNYKATMYGFVEHFYNIFRRNLYLQTQQDINRYIESIEKKPVTMQINVFWGLLTPKERNDIIASFLIKNRGIF